LVRGLLLADFSGRRADGHTSGKVGSKAIILEDGKGLFGWVGGGCVETTVLHEALKTLKDGCSRTILLEEDELRGTGVPCGGKMEVYLEPVLPKKTAPPIRAWGNS
jgi:xanthine dehydrogenase accessory factor